jgi:hypothetical protein
MAHSPPPSSGPPSVGPPSVGPPSVGPPPAGKKPVTGHTRTFVLAVDRAVYWFSKHWLAVLNSMAAIYVGLPILAPVLMAVGATRPGQMIYTLYPTPVNIATNRLLTNNRRLLQKSSMALPSVTLIWPMPNKY